MIAPAPIVPALNTDASKAGRVAAHGWLHGLVVLAAWSVFVGFHAVVLLFFGVSGYTYWVLPQRGEANFLALYRIGMGSQHYSTIALSYSVVALLHAISLLYMIGASISRRRLVFTWSGSTPPSTRSSARRGIVHGLRRRVWLVYASLLSPTGFFGVNGPCFDLLLLLRELLETALQTNQAYRMSRFLARAWINQFYVCLLVVNCWLLAVLHTAFHQSPTTRYFALLLCDLLLDFVSSMVVTLVLLVLYSSDFDFDTSAGNLFGLKWFDDEWQMNAINEFQIVFVSSWTDLASRIIFSLSMISNLNTLKRFVGLAAHSSGREHEWRLRWTSIVTEAHLRPVPTRLSMGLLVRANAMVRSSPRFTKAIRLVFAVWGAAVLALHVGAASKQNVSSCVLQVRPWGIRQPSCNLVMVNCYSEGIAGERSELDDRLRVLHSPSVLKLLVRHCPALDMPPVLQSFSSLGSIKVYNTSISVWDQDAALAKSKHPELSLLTLLRVRFADGKIPPGLLTDDFPRTLAAFTSFHSNIEELPGDLDEKWSKVAYIHIAWGQLTRVPSALVRLAPQMISLPGNPIQSVDKEVFEAPGVRVLDLSATAITALPDDVSAPSKTLTSIGLDDTSISAFPAWVDEWARATVSSMHRISAAASPYCVERARIFSGELAAFTSPANGSRLMNAAVDNWRFLNQTVNCTPGKTFRYPVALDDRNAALPS